MSKVAVIGNTARAIGAVCAADLTLSGHEVRYTVFPEQQHQLPELRKAGGYTVEGDAQHLISKQTGFARLDKICDTTREALKTAEAVLIEVDIHQLEAKFGAMIPDFAAAASVLQTGLENLNLIVHPAMVLPNVGMMERAKLDGKKIGFYQECVVPAAGSTSARG